MPTDNMLLFRVRLHSTPSPAYTFYEGLGKVLAEDAEAARDLAVRELRRGTFRDRPADSWVVDAVEVVR